MDLDRALDDFARRNMVRNVLKDGLALEEKDGTNPFKLGFIGSTDTHSATPGGSEEDNYTGHLGRRDAGYRNVQDHFFDNPGGLAVVWAEENSREAIFQALRRRDHARRGTAEVVQCHRQEGLALEAGEARKVSEEEQPRVAQHQRGGMHPGDDAADARPMR